MNTTYKPHEEILVWNSKAVIGLKRFFIGFAKSGRVLAEDETGSVSLWDSHSSLPKKEIVMWGPEDITPGMRLRRKTWAEGGWAAPIEASQVHVYFRNATVTYAELLAEWETLDGKPCGKEVETK